MKPAPAALQPGQRVRHPQHGEGVISQAEGARRQVFFPAGERWLPADQLAPLARPEDALLAGVEGSAARLQAVRLSVQAHRLPLQDSGAALTSAPIDLLPHQLVLTHRVAEASPRRFLVADEVGLGKTIEAALILRELDGRGELERALMVVPAGLVENWQRELNEVFSLGFEVFGAQGDVSDRRSNAFTKHNRLIASVDTLKRPSRLKRLLAAPSWDLVVFDEAHHLSAYRQGKKTKRTENFKLAEALREHCRDLLLLSATPHQGDHFRFWMLTQLLSPGLFTGPEDMVDNRQRLNAYVFRRTKADACRPDGSTLFRRREVHAEAALMSEEERGFYEALRSYLSQGFALAKREGKKGQGLGFVMAIFQKIAASSFAAVRRTLKRRLLGLSIREALHQDEELNLDARDACYAEARALIREASGLGESRVDDVEVERQLAELKLQLAKKLQTGALELAAEGASELSASKGEDMSALAMTLALPAEREQLRALLARFPDTQETKLSSLLRALDTLWKENPRERVVIFATYLGTVDLVAAGVEARFPDKGVTVLKGGDHGAKLAAERRFRREDGPRVLICTAAGREGINLQFSRVLFNFDLPWNPMDLEQRIGRIHRYGQEHTAQVYNLVLSDTIEGRIFLLLDAKLADIQSTLGKRDARGQEAENLRAQILGQLSERVPYQRLYREALSDPELKRTEQELEVAVSQAKEARSVVWELFQDLDGFDLDEYRPLGEVAEKLNALVGFLGADLAAQGGSLRRVDSHRYTAEGPEGRRQLTTSRELARAEEGWELIGLDHPWLQSGLQRCQSQPPERLGASVAQGSAGPGALSWWRVDEDGPQRRSHLICVAVHPSGKRHPALEAEAEAMLSATPAPPCLDPPSRQRLLSEHIRPALDRALRHRGISQASLRVRLVGWVEAGKPPELRRGWDSEAGQARAREQLVARAARFFGAAAEPTAATAPDRWRARLVSEPEGLAVEIGPLTGLWRFITRLRLVGDAPSSGGDTLLAENARRRPMRLPVLPTGSPWRWEAVGFEDDPDIDLSALALPAPALDAVTVFAVQADGRGRELSGTRLSANKQYQLLLPPGIGGVQAGEDLGAGWRLLTLSPEAPLPKASLQELGLKLSAQDALLQLGASCWPHAWSETPSGAPYPCLPADRPLRLEARCPSGPARLLVHGPDSTETIDLAGHSWVELSELQEGLHYCSLLPEDPAAAPAHLPFSIQAIPTPRRRLGWSLKIGDASWRGGPGKELRVPSRDLSALPPDDAELSTPPGWAIQLRWRALGEQHIGAIEASEAGRVDMAEVWETAAPRLSGPEMGELVLDMGTLGRLCFEHQAARSPEPVAAALAQILRLHEDRLRTQEPDAQAMFATWFAPVCAQLGYRLGPPAPDPEDPAPSFGLPAALHVIEGSGGRLRQRTRRVLVLLKRLEPELDEATRAWIDRRCRAHQVDSALITDGLAWAEHRHRSRLPLEVWQLPEVLSHQDEQLIPFLRDLAEGL